MGPTEFTSLLADNTLIVAHDAGSAAVIANNLDVGGSSELVAVAEGPATNILRPRVRVFGRDQLDRLLADSDQVLAATGWQSDLTGVALSGAKTAGLRTVGLVDRNKNLELRFRHQNELLIPDLIIAPSQTKLTLPTSLNRIPVLYLDDVGFERLVSEVRELKISTEKTYDFLFIGQPVVDANGSVDSESQFAAIRTLWLDSRDSKRIGFRPHPSQTDNLDGYLPDGVRICDTREPATLQIAQAKSVVGFDSILLDIADAAGVPCSRIDHGAHRHAS
jgi:hypothetical protein